MKKVIAAAIEQVIQFETDQEVQEYLNFVQASGASYQVVDRDGTTIRIRKQYNKNKLLLAGKEVKEK